MLLQFQLTWTLLYLLKLKQFLKGNWYTTHWHIYYIQLRQQLSRGSWIVTTRHTTQRKKSATMVQKQLYVLGISATTTRSSVFLTFIVGQHCHPSPPAAGQATTPLLTLQLSASGHPSLLAANSFQPLSASRLGSLPSFPSIRYSPTPPLQSVANDLEFQMLRITMAKHRLLHTVALQVMRMRVA